MPISNLRETSTKLLAGVAAAIAAVTLVGCSTSAPHSNDASRDLAPVEAAPPAVDITALTQGDRVSVPALDALGEATVLDTPSEGSRRVDVEFSAVPIDAVEAYDTADSARACTMITAPEADGVIIAYVDAPNGTRSTFEDQPDGSQAAELLCVSQMSAGDGTALLPYLDERKAAVLDGSEVVILASVGESALGEMRRGAD